MLRWHVTHFSSCKTKTIALGYNLHDPNSTKYSVSGYWSPELEEVDVLEIHNIEFDDAGEYICSESHYHVADPDSASITLTVFNCTMREGKYYHN